MPGDIPVYTIIVKATDCFVLNKVLLHVASCVPGVFEITTSCGVWVFFYLRGSKSLNKNSSHKVAILISQVIPHFQRGISQAISMFPGNLAEEKEKLNIVLTD